MADTDVPAVHWAALPADEAGLVLARLPLHDVLHAGATCRAWMQHTRSEQLWHARCLAQWRHWADSEEGRQRGWRATYRRRHQLDGRVLWLLQDAVWPARQEAAYPELMREGRDVLDVLAAAARAAALTCPSGSEGHGSCLLLGVAHRARAALAYNAAFDSAQQLQALLLATSEQQQQQQQQEEEADGLLQPVQQQAAQQLVQLLQGEADALLQALQQQAQLQAQPPPPPPPQQQQQQQEEEVDVLLEVALLLARTMHPLTDIAAVRRLIERLGEELERRLAAAGAAPDSLQALLLLNQLLFGPPAAAAETAGASSGSGGSSGGHGHGSDTLPASWWQRDEELDGPDLSRVVVPEDGHSGLGLQGSPADSYYTSSSNLLDCVLASRTGLPLSLALLHRSVGRRAGLDIDAVNTPGHVVNRVSLAGGQASAALGPAAGGGSSGDAAPGGGRVVFVDVFDAGKLLDAGELRELLALKLGPHLDADSVQLLQARLRRLPLGAGWPEALCARMLRNLVTALSSQRHAGDPAGADARLRPLRLAALVLCLELLRLGGVAGRLVKEGWEVLEPELMWLLQQHDATGRADWPHTAGESVLLRRMLLRSGALGIQFMLESGDQCRWTQHWRAWLNRRQAASGASRAANPPSLWATWSPCLMPASALWLRGPADRTRRTCPSRGRTSGCWSPTVTRPASCCQRRCLVAAARAHLAGSASSAAQPSSRSASGSCARCAAGLMS